MTLRADQLEQMAPSRALLVKMLRAQHNFGDWALEPTVMRLHSASDLYDPGVVANAILHVFALVHRAQVAERINMAEWLTDRLNALQAYGELLAGVMSRP